MMKTVAAIACAIALLAPLSASAGEVVGPARTPSCRYRYLDDRVQFSAWEVQRTIRCAVHRWDVPGGVGLALCIAERESHFAWFADNPTSSASGVYQFVAGTWAGATSHYSRFMRWQEIGRSVWNARSNVLIAIRIAHDSGWGPWGGGC